MTLRSQLRAPWRSPALRATLVYGIAGVGFSGANLLLARTLSYSDFALFALMLTFFNVGIPIAPAGADGVVNRRHIHPGVQLLRRALLTSLVAGIVLAVVARWLYGIDDRFLVLLLVAIVAGGANYVAAAHFQSVQRFGVSLSLFQGANFVLMAAATLAWIAGVRGLLPILAVLTTWYIAAAVTGWFLLLRRQPADGAPGERFVWAEALSILGVSGVGIVLGQLERLMIPRVLSLEDLATYGVLAAIVGSAFRMMWMGVGYTMLPRLRRANTAAERRRLLAGEGAVVLFVTVLASAVIWHATPFVIELFLAGKYILPPALVLAAIIAGIAKVASAFSKATTTALGTTRDLARLNALSWISLGIAVAGATFGAQWGLTGVVYGVAAGWVSLAVAGAVLALPHLRECNAARAVVASSSRAKSAAGIR